MNDPSPLDRRPRARAALGLEVLEARDTPSVTPLEAARGITGSEEYITSLVRDAYTHHLARTPSADEVAAWVGAYRAAGLTESALDAAFVGSAERLAKDGGLGEGWLRGLYQGLLRRAADQGEIDAWLNAAASGASAVDIARGFAVSAECLAARVQDAYALYLGRAATAAEVGAWVDSLQKSAGGDVDAAVLGSDEYFRKVGGATEAALWLIGAYEQGLGRAPSEQEVRDWLGDSPPILTEGNSPAVVRPGFEGLRWGGHGWHAFDPRFNVVPIVPDTNWQFDNTSVAEQSWGGSVPLAVAARVPRLGYVADEATWQVLWAALHRREEVPAVDFSRYLVVAAFNGDPNALGVTVSRGSTPGDLQVSAISTLVYYFHPTESTYALVLVPRAGVTTIEGQPLV